MAVRAVLFDLGDTVVRLGAFPSDMPERVARHVAEVLPEAEDGLAERIASECAAAIRLAGQQAAHDEVRLPQVVGRCIAAAVDSNVDVCAHIADAFGHADLERIFDVPGRVALMDALKARGLKLGIVSNTTTRGDLLSAMLERFGLLASFDAVVYSSEVGIRKPHAGIYESALRAVNVGPAEALFVGDRLREDVLGPQALGMRGVLTHEFFQSQHNGEPYAVVTSLEEVRDLVGDR